jgi:hypothetical protein
MNPGAGIRNPEPGTRNPEPGTRKLELGTQSYEDDTHTRENVNDNWPRQSRVVGIKFGIDSKTTTPFPKFSTCEVSVSRNVEGSPLVAFFYAAMRTGGECVWNECTQMWELE